MSGPSKPLKWLRLLKNVLLSVCIQHGDYAGYRVVRVLRARLNLTTKEVVYIRARLFGGRSDVHDGFNGHIISLDRRKSFHGGRSLGVVTGADITDIDTYARSIYKKAKEHKQMSAAVKPRLLPRKQPPNIFVPLESPPPPRQHSLSEISKDDQKNKTELEDMRRCKRCGSPLGVSNACSDKTCAFHSHMQDCPQGWVGHPEVPDKLKGCTCGSSQVAAKSPVFEEDPEPTRPRVETDFYENIPELKYSLSGVLPEPTLQKLAALLKAKPGLLSHGRTATDLPKQAFWKVKCPAGDVLELTGYRRTVEAGPATEMILTGYINKGRKRFKGGEMPKSEVIAAVNALLKATPMPAPAVKKPAVKPKPKPKKKLKPDPRVLDIEPAMPEPKTRKTKKPEIVDDLFDL